ncbi:MAG: hypothetical protein RLZZ08_403 [Pseudomonadota bacterium]|jgi:ubiquinone biosynthesis protein COQ9
MADDTRTLADLRLQLAPELARSAAFDGWSDEALAQAAAMAGLDPAVARLAFPGGAMDMIDAWIASIDDAMQRHFAGDLLAGMKVRDRITALITFRIDSVAGMEESLRRAWAVQSLPQNLLRTTKISWRSADAMWRLAGDVATDYNHYTKRATLAGIYTATLAVFMGDDSDGKAETRAFLARRIEGIMQFEKAKARLLQPREHFDMARFLGRLRYPAR